MPQKLIDLIKHYDHILDRAAVEAPRQNIERMLEKVIGLGKVDLYLNPERKLSTAEEAKIAKLVERRLNFEPLQYILGECEFYGIKFKADPRALIPRPETEFVVSTAIDMIDGRAGLHILDLATGSGNIIISIAVNSPDQNFHATDLSRDSLQLAEENAHLNNVADKIQFHCGNLFNPVKEVQVKFDIITSNPPYIREGEFDNLHEQIKRFEPRRALLSGADGLDFIRPMLAGAGEYLKPGGYLISEVAMGQAPQVKRMAVDEHGLEHIQTVEDYRGIERVVVFRLAESPANH